MNPRRADYAEYMRSIFDGAPFIRDLGVELIDLGPGFCETALAIAPRPARADRLACRATVLKAGTVFHVVEAEVRTLDSLIAKMMATVAVVPAERTRR
jgi:acyl-coenzyme A thioesterase PaaI-like protein